MYRALRYPEARSIVLPSPILFAGILLQGVHFTFRLIFLSSCSGFSFFVSVSVFLLLLSECLLVPTRFVRRCEDGTGYVRLGSFVGFFVRMYVYFSVRLFSFICFSS